MTTEAITHDKTPDQHSDIVGGSSSARVINCPASVAMLGKLGGMVEAEAAQYDAMAAAATDDTEAAEFAEKAAGIRASLNRSSSYADEGTGLHEVMAYLVDNDVDQMMLSTDEKVDELFAQYDLSEQRFFDAVIPAYREFNKYLDGLFAEAEAAGFADPEIRILVEQRVELPGIDGAFGTSDITIRTPVRTAIWDWKFGAGVPVYASYKRSVEGSDEPQDFGNEQLSFYGRGAQHTHPDYFEDDPEWPVDLVICQPRIGDGEPSIYHSTVQELEDFRLDLIDAVDLAIEKGLDAPMSKGSHCRFADCKQICKLHLNGAEAAAEITSKLSKLRDTTLTLQDLKTAEVELILPGEPMPSSMTMGDAYAVGLQLADTLGPLLSALGAGAQSFLEAGGEIPGYKLVPKKAGHDKWEDDDKAEKFLGRAGVPLEERRVVKPITPAVAKAKLKALGKLDEKGAKVLAKYIKPGVSSGHTLAAADDNREAVVLTSAAIGALANKLASL